MMQETSILGDEDTGDEGNLMLGDEVEMDVVGAFILLLVAGNHHH